MATGGEALPHITWSVVTDRLSSWVFEHQEEFLAGLCVREKEELCLGKGSRGSLCI